MTNGTLEERTLSEISRLCHAGLDGPELLRATIERLRRVVPFEAYCASTVDPMSGLVTRSLAEEMGGAEEAEIFFERLYFEHDMIQLIEMTREGRPVALLSEHDGRLERSPRYRELLGPLGLAHEMRGVFTAGGRMWGSVDLIRERGRPDFEPRQAALLRRVAPHLGAGLRAAALRAQTAAVGPDGADSPGVLTLGRDGRVVQHTPAAERWLRDLDDLRPGWREWTGLPPAVRMVAAALQRALSGGVEGMSGYVPHLRMRGRSGRWLTLHGSRTEADRDRPAETVIVIQPAKPEEVAWINVAAYGLSDREREVIQLVVRGASTRQISRALFISEYTVQNHLSNVFEKVGVRSRRELVRRLFFDNLYPTLFA